MILPKRIAQFCTVAILRDSRKIEKTEISIIFDITNRSKKMKLYKRGNKYWVYFWDSENKRHIRVSTGTSDLSTAEMIMLRDYGHVMAEEKGRRMETIARVTRDSIEDATSRAAGNMKLANATDVFDFSKGRGGRELSKHTRNAALMSWRLFVEFCETRGVVLFSQVTTKICNDFFDMQKPRMREVAFIYIRKMFCNVYPDAGIFTKIEKPRRRRDEHAVHREPLSIEQIGSILEYLDSQQKPDSFEFAVWFRFMVYTGLRMGDAASFKWSDMDLRQRIVRRLYTEKTSSYVTFPIHDSLARKIEELREAQLKRGEKSIYMFPNMNAKQEKTWQILSRRVARVLTVTGIKGKGKPGEFCAHCLRATFATFCVENGIPIEVVQSWLGHKSEMITWIYARFNDIKRKRDAVSRFPDIG